MCCGDAPKGPRALPIHWRTRCAWCDTPHHAPPGYACMHCSGPLLEVFDPVQLEAAEDPDQRPYTWE